MELPNRAVGAMLLLSGLLLSTPACKKEDPCADNCVNGHCVDGDCVCNEGYEGAWCGTYSGPVTGKFMAWMTYDAGCWVSIYVNGTYVGQVSGWWSSVPTCDAQYCMTTVLDVGTYTVTGQCNGTTWGPSTISVTQGGCYKLQLL